MIHIDRDRCNGCGTCVDVCPHGAIYLVDGKATVDTTLCRECVACKAACPTDAIALVNPAPERARTKEVAVCETEPPVVRLAADTRLVPLRAKVLPLLGLALSWAGREIAPRLADYFISRLDRTSESEHTLSIRPVDGLAVSGRAGSRGARQWRARSRWGKR